MEYLKWYKRVLNIPVKNQTYVQSITPIENQIKISIQNQGDSVARKVILATGRGGFGGVKVPPFVKHLPKTFYAHTSELIDFPSFKGKNIAILGIGASAFDAAASALENDAGSVTLLSKRKTIPFVNKFAGSVYPGFGLGYANLPDVAKIKIMQNALENGNPPPFESLDRVHKIPNFKVLSGIDIDDIEVQNGSLSLKTNHGSIKYDFLILGTGFEVDGSMQPELQDIFKDILLWENACPSIPAPFGAFPYLGRHYEFQEKKTGAAPYLKNIYCFNYGATLSHGLTSSDIPDISIGANRLAQGIVSDFFTQHWHEYYDRFQKYAVAEFLEANYPFFQPKQI